MNYKQRQDFRKSHKWKEFKHKCRLHTSKDFITKKPLERGWNLHHLDLNIQRYDNINDMKRFMPLNEKTHEIIHELYKWYSKDHKVLDRIKITLDKMEEYTNGPDGPDARDVNNKHNNKEHDKASSAVQA